MTQRAVTHFSPSIPLTYQSHGYTAALDDSPFAGGNANSSRLPRRRLSASPHHAKSTIFATITMNYQSLGYTKIPWQRETAAVLAVLAATVTCLTPQSAVAASPDGLDAAAVAALLAALGTPAGHAQAVGGPAAAAGATASGTMAALRLPFAVGHASLGLPSLDMEAGLLSGGWAERTVQVYGSTSVFLSPRHGLAGGARVVAGAVWQATWPDTVVRVGAALAGGASVGVDQGLVPLVPGELSVEVARGTKSAWWFTRLSAGAELAAAPRWTARITFTLGVLLGR